MVIDSCALLRDSAAGWRRRILVARVSRRASTISSVSTSAVDHTRTRLERPLRTTKHLLATSEARRLLMVDYGVLSVRSCARSFQLLTHTVTLCVQI